MTQHELLNAIRKDVEEIRDTVQFSLSLRAVGGSFITNKTIELLKMIDKLEASFS